MIQQGKEREGGPTLHMQSTLIKMGELSHWHCTTQSDWVNWSYNQDPFFFHPCAFFCLEARDYTILNVDSVFLSTPPSSPGTTLIVFAECFYLHLLVVTLLCIQETLAICRGSVPEIPANGKICEYIRTLAAASTELPQMPQVLPVAGEGRVKRSRLDGSTEDWSWEKNFPGNGAAD